MKRSCFKELQSENPATKQEIRSLGLQTEATRHCLSVLHVEDNKRDAELVLALLESEGFVPEITRVETKSDFSSAIANGNFDVIISDFSLPSFDGKTALKLSQAQRPEIPFIFVSGTLGEESAIDSLQHGAADYVLKNRLSRLGTAIRRALKDKREQQQRKKVEKELHRSNELCRQITENVGDLIAVLDLKGNWQYASPSYFALLDEETLRTGGDAFAPVHPEDLGRLRAAFDEIVETGVGKREEFRLLLRDGSTRFIESQTNVIRDDAGAILTVISVSRDVSERKRSEEELLRTQAELKQTNEDLLGRTQEIQNFYHTLSHELKTPLTSAREFIAIVMDGLAGTLNETQFDYLRIAKESCNQLRMCLNDLLDATRLETGKLQIDLKPASLGDLIHQVMAMMGPVAAKKNIKMTKKVQSRLPSIPIDSNRITQVLTNLLNNALKFTPEGGKIILEVSEPEGRPEFLRVAISDTGRGIPSDQLARIFDRLYQVKLGDATTEQGIGLGLYICRELIELHGGTVSVESMVDAGSTFSFLLPKEQTANECVVLVADDDPDVLESIGYALQNSEFTVLSTHGGAQALAEMAKRVPDVVVLDLEMPGTDGAATLKEIRKRWGLLPVIIHTGFPDSDLMMRALESSPFTCLCKPATEAQLIETIRMVRYQGKRAAA
jgi:PAS domain S-box-containing protein